MWLWWWCWVGEGERIRESDRIVDKGKDIVEEGWRRIRVGSEIVSFFCFEKKGPFEIWIGRVGSESFIRNV